MLKGQNGAYVYVVGDDSRVYPQPVTPGPALHGETIIEKGLMTGTIVAVEDQIELAPGTLIKGPLRTGGL